MVATGNSNLHRVSSHTSQAPHDSNSSFALLITQKPPPSFVPHGYNPLASFPPNDWYNPVQGLPSKPSTLYDMSHAQAQQSQSNSALSSQPFKTAQTHAKSNSQPTGPIGSTKLQSNAGFTHQTPAKGPPPGISHDSTGTGASIQPPNTAPQTTVAFTPSTITPGRNSSFFTLHSFPSQDSEDSNTRTPPGTTRAKFERQRRKQTEQLLKSTCKEKDQLIKSQQNTIENQSKTQLVDSQTLGKQQGFIENQQVQLDDKQAKLDDEREKRHQHELELARLANEVATFKQQSSERNVQIATLLLERENNTFFQSMSRMQPQDLFYAIAKVSVDWAGVRRELDQDDLELPSVMSCDLTEFKPENLPKFLKILLPSVCCYSASLNVLLMLTASDDRQGVTDDIIDYSYSELLPKIGYTKSNSFSFVFNQKDFVLAIASPTAKAAAGPIGLLGKGIALSKGSERFTLEGSEPDGKPELPFHAADISAIFKNGATETFIEVTWHKVTLTCEQQRAHKTAKGKTPIVVIMDRVAFDKEEGKIPLLEKDTEKGEPLSLGFIDEVNIDYSELSLAIGCGCVGSIQFEGVKLMDGQEHELKQLLLTARANHCSFSLRRMEHATKSEKQMMKYFEELSIAPDAFSEMAPESDEPTSAVDDSALKKPKHNIWGELPSDLVYCNHCDSLGPKQPKCLVCGNALNSGEVTGAKMPTNDISLHKATSVSAGTPDEVSGFKFGSRHSDETKAAPVHTGNGFCFETQPSDDAEEGSTGGTRISGAGSDEAKPGSTNTGSSGGGFKFMSQLSDATKAAPADTESNFSSETQPSGEAKTWPTGTGISGAGFTFVPAPAQEGCFFGVQPPNETKVPSSVNPGASDVATYSTKEVETKIGDRGNGFAPCASPNKAWQYEDDNTTKKTPPDSFAMGPSPKVLFSLDEEPSLILARSPDANTVLKHEKVEGDRPEKSGVAPENVAAATHLSGFKNSEPETTQHKPRGESYKFPTEETNSGSPVPLLWNDACLDDDACLDSCAGLFSEAELREEFLVQQGQLVSLCFMLSHNPSPDAHASPSGKDCLKDIAAKEPEPKTTSHKSGGKSLDRLLSTEKSRSTRKGKCHKSRSFLWTPLTYV